jgi:hypothetical protein
MENKNFKSLEIGPFLGALSVKFISKIARKIEEIRRHTTESSQHIPFISQK